MSGQRPALGDLALALSVGTAIAIDAVHSDHARGPLAANVVVCLAIGMPLAWRRIAPLATAIAVILVAMLQTDLLTPLPRLVTPLSLAVIPAYAVAARGTTRRACAGLAVCLAGVPAIELATPAAQRDGSAVVPAFAIVLVSWLAGRAVAAQGRRVGELEAVDRRLASTRLARERLAVAEQRAHVARELHDVVAHSMTVICLQAGAAQRLWFDRPTEGRKALAAVGVTARETLAHLRDTLALLDHGASDRTEPRRDLEALISRARSAGLDVTIQIDGCSRALPGGVGLVAYRLVQEALTNAIRHAAPTAVTVRLAYEVDVLTVDVRDEGRQASLPGAVAVPGSGNGLRGMLERVERCSGVLSFGPLPSGGFAVSARLPIETTT
jgi:signal transduction histidine kinase